MQIFFAGPADGVGAIRVALASVREALGRPEMENWDCFDALIDHFLATHAERVAVELARSDRRVFARDRFRCRMPGFHNHHILFRSLGGGDEDSNRATLCALCHNMVIHAGYARMTGNGDRELRVELGVREGKSPLSTWVGERKAERDERREKIEIA